MCGNILVVSGEGSGEA